MTWMDDYQVNAVYDADYPEEATLELSHGWDHEFRRSLEAGCSLDTLVAAAQAHHDHLYPPVRRG